MLLASGRKTVVRHLRGEGDFVYGGFSFAKGGEVSVLQSATPLIATINRERTTDEWAALPVRHACADSVLSLKRPQSNALRLTLPVIDQLSHYIGYHDPRRQSSGRQFVDSQRRQQIPTPNVRISVSTSDSPDASSNAAAPVESSRRAPARTAFISMTSPSTSMMMLGVMPSNSNAVISVARNPCCSGHHQRQLTKICQLHAVAARCAGQFWEAITE